MQCARCGRPTNHETCNWDEGYSLCADDDLVTCRLTRPKHNCIQALYAWRQVRKWQKAKLKTEVQLAASLVALKVLGVEDESFALRLVGRFNQTCSYCQAYPRDGKKEHGYHDSRCAVVKARAAVKKARESEPVCSKCEETIKVGQIVSSVDGGKSVRLAHAHLPGEAIFGVALEKGEEGDVIKVAVSGIIRGEEGDR